MRRWFAAVIGVAVISGLSCTEDLVKPTPPEEVDEGIVYVLNQTDGTMMILDAATLDPIDTVATGVPAPHHMEFSPDGEYLYVISRSVPGVLAKFSHEEGTALISTVTMSGNPTPSALAIVGDGTYGYTGDFTPAGLRGHLHKYNLSTMTFVDSSLQSGATTHDLKVAPGYDMVLAVNLGSDDITVLFTANDSIDFINVDPVNPSPTDAVYGPYGLLVRDSLAYVACLAGPDKGVGRERQIRVVNLNTLEIVDSMDVPIDTNKALVSGPTLMAMSSDDRYLWTTTQNGNSVVAIDLSTKQVIANIRFHIPISFGIDISGDNKSVFVACANAPNQQGMVYKIDTATRTKVDSAWVGKNSYGLHWHHGLHEH